MYLNSYLMSVIRTKQSDHVDAPAPTCSFFFLSTEILQTFLQRCWSVCARGEAVSGSWSLHAEPWSCLRMAEVILVRRSTSLFLLLRSSWNSWRKTGSMRSEKDNFCKILHVYYNSERLRGNTNGNFCFYFAYIYIFEVWKSALNEFFYVINTNFEAGRV